MTRIPLRYFLDFAYDLLRRSVTNQYPPDEDGQNAARQHLERIDRALNTPFGVHPESTPEAMRRRMEQTARMMEGT
jgi:hypothetical protein